jgi:RHH-type transcriptional regulator, proline utilization regulon repressor / proline dehydrogenase / delta 1-pyrroline-5-carboxylate dehydrogenase
MSEFSNEPILELRRAAARESLLEGMRAFEQRPPIKVPVWIGDGERHGDEIASTDPGNPERVVATATTPSAPTDIMNVFSTFLERTRPA